MNTVAVASAALILILTVSDASSARQISHEYKARQFAVNQRLVGIRLAADALIALPIKQIQGALGVPIDLELTPPAKDLKFVMFQAIPANIKFSHGFPANNNWYVSINNFEELTLMSTREATEPVAFEVFYFRDNKQLVARGLVVINFVKTVSTEMASQQDPPKTAISGLVSEEEKNLPSKVPTISLKQESADLEQANLFLRNGDISSARRILEFLASQGSANGARALAETYDPGYLRNVVVTGLQPDVERAKHWYKRAAALGDSKAATRLSVLDGH